MVTGLIGPYLSELLPGCAGAAHFASSAREDETRPPETPLHYPPRFRAENFKTLVSGGGAINVFAGVFGGSAEKKAGSAGAGVGGALLELTPHKMAMCHLVQVFAPPAQAGAAALPFPFESVAHHNRLGLFLLALTRSCEDFLEPPLEEVLRQLKAVDDLVNGWLCEQLTCTLSALTSTDDLFNFFDKLRGVLTPPEEGANVEDVFLDPNSQLGVFLRCCILAFNSMTFEGVCHLLANLVVYCSSTDTACDLAEDEDVCHLLANLVVYCSSTDTACDLAEDEDFNSEMEMTNLMDADIGVRAGIFDKYSQGYAAAAESYIGESSSSLIHAPISLHNFCFDFNGSVELFCKMPNKNKKKAHQSFQNFPPPRKKNAMSISPRKKS